MGAFDSGAVTSKRTCLSIAHPIASSSPIFRRQPTEDAIALPVPTLGEDIVDDYRSMDLTLGAHPLSLLRTRLRAGREAHDAPFY